MAAGDVGCVGDVVGSFGAQLETLLKKTVAGKEKELDDREAAVSQREAKVHGFLNAQHSADKVVVRVGQRTFQTTRATLLRVPESYFHGMLSPEFQQEADGTYFIDRDGDSFQYVLEFLVYGELFSRIAERGTLKKLEMDADFYCLPKLLDQVQQQLGSQPVLHNVAVWRSSRSVGHGAFQPWEMEEIAPDRGLYVLSADQTGIRVQREGIFAVEAQVTASPDANNRYVSIMKNNQEVTRACGTCPRHEGNTHRFSYRLSAVVHVGAGDEIALRNLSGSPTMAAAVANFFRISVCH